MAKLVTEHTFKGNITKVFKAISSYDKYNDYLDMVSGVEVYEPEEDGSVAMVNYTVNIIKEFNYMLHMFHDEPKKIWWTLAESDFIKVSEGSWEFTDKGNNETEAKYSIEIKVKGFMPQALIDKATKATIPTLMKNMQALIDAS